jgi:hypothetical protein
MKYLLTFTLIAILFTSASYADKPSIPVGVESITEWKMDISGAEDIYKYNYTPPGSPWKTCQDSIYRRSISTFCWDKANAITIKGGMIKNVLSEKIQKLKKR